MLKIRKTRHLRRNRPTPPLQARVQMGKVGSPQQKTSLMAAGGLPGDTM